jgi:hypothetical protein
MYTFDLIKMNDDLELISYQQKNVYNTDQSTSADEWVKLEIKRKKTFDTPQQGSPLIIKQKGNGKLVKNALGYFLNSANSVMLNRTGCSLFSSGYSNGHGFSITIENFTKVCTLFSARKLILETWDTQKDEYLKPNENHQEFKKYQYDSIVYSLFSTYSYQSSLRQIEYKDKQWDIKNEFFWMSVEKMKELADQNGYDELYNDARTSSDRYVHKLLFGEERIYDRLSPDAKAVLDKATELVERSMELRQVMANDENHLNSWDAGYAQLKLVWKEYFQEEFKEFRQLYKALEDRMRPLVYELGFLKK